MIQDDEFEVLLSCPERAVQLGYKPQMEIVTNRLLPYAAELDEESRVFLDQVKTNLAKAVLLREMKPACGVWSSRLMKYLRIYGLKFSKEDHIAFIKLAYELVIIPDLEPCKIHKFATLFLMLTKKRHLVSPEELTLPWRPLYDVGQKLFERNLSHIGIYHYLTSLEGSFMSMVKSAKTYFPLSATKEILAQILPLICPWNSDSQALVHLSVFLPVGLHPRHAAHGHLLWFDELLQLWETCHNAHCSISDVMSIFAGLAKRNPGAVDWTPHVPGMFMRFLHALNLPVSYKDMQYSTNHTIYTKHMAAWIVWSIRPDGVVLRHLRSFLAGVESYLHSANQGRWSYKLRDLLRKLAREFLVRFRREREKRFRKSWENQTPEESRLRDEDVTEFVNIVLEPTLQAVYSRSGSLDISTALHDLATLRPALVVPPLVDKLQTSLTSLTEPHRVTAAMSAVAAVARPLLRGPHADYPEGPTHVVPLLLSVLPGLDPNDLKKTLVTLHFILVFSWMVPYVDCSNAHEYYDDLTEEELLTCESTAQLEDFVLVFLERLFAIIESSTMENVRLDTKETDWGRSKTDAVVETAISSAATAVLMQCSPRIFGEALRKFRAFATESTFETSVAGSMVGVLLRVFARVDARSTLAAFLPPLCEEILAIFSSSEDAHRDDDPPRALLYRIVLLMHAVECDGAVLLEYVPTLLPVLDRILRLHAVYALTRAATVLAHALSSLAFIDLKDWRSSPKDYGAAPARWLPVREWGAGCLLSEADFKWHVPTEAEVRCVQDLFDRYLGPEVTRLRQWLTGERDMTKERRLRSLRIVHAAFAASTLLPPPPEDPAPLMESLVPATNIPFGTGVPHEVRLEGRNVRVALTELLTAVQTKLLAERSDDTKGLEMLVQIWERVVSPKGPRSGPGLEARMRSYGVLERALDGHGARAADSAGPARLRMLLADAARLQDEARLDLACDAGITPTALAALHALFDLSTYTYSSVRVQAQSYLYWMLGHYPYSYKALVPRLAELLRAGADGGGGGADAGGGGAGEEWHARHKGALFVLLIPRSAPLIAKQDWETARTLWPAVLAAPLSEKPSIVKLEAHFADTLHRNFPSVNTKLVLPDSVLAAARRFLTPDQLAAEDFAKLEREGPAREAALNAKYERAYLELVDELVSAAEAPGVVWRRLELALLMLTFSTSFQTPLPPRAVRLVVRSLVHDDVSVRRMAQRLTHYALKQRKHPLKKIAVDPYEVAGVPRPERPVRGYRPDLEWAMWAPDSVPQTDDEWDRPWLRHPCVAFYAWPERILVAAPLREQSFALDTPPEQLEEGERYMYEFFSDEATVDRLVGFLTVEEKKGKDKFSGIRFAMFRMAFAHFGERVAGRFLEHARRCARDQQEAAQRFAAEVAAAALRAPRYWPRERAHAMCDAAVDVIRAGLSAVTPETMEDWGTCLATATEKYDPARGGRVLAELLELCAPAGPGDAPAPADRDASFVVCARLYALQGALGSLAWRGAPLAAALLRRLDAAEFLHHPYQNVRETVGSVLMTIFDTELAFGLAGGRGAGWEGVPSLEAFLESVRPRLAALYDENGDVVVKTAASLAPALPPRSAPPPPAPVDVSPAPRVAHVEVSAARLSPERSGDEAPAKAGSESPDADEACADRLQKRLATRLDAALRLAGDGGAPSAQEHARAVNLLTTVLRGCMGVIVRCAHGGTAAQYALVPIACALAARGPPQPHDELPRAADGFLASLARTPHSSADFDAALGVLERLATGRSWWARLAGLDFAQPLLFYGLPLLCARGERAVRAEAFALGLMRDPRVEVRSAAAKLLTGLMHCRALPDEDATLGALTASCRSRDPVERHRGVLGLCAYLSSRPYGLGARLGEALAELSRHTSAPDPVPATIRRALQDFRRTHHDDWARHRDRLTEDELDLLADLTAPPSYCA